VFRPSFRYHLDTHIHLPWPRERTARRLPATPKRPRSQPRSKPSRTKRRPRSKSKNGQRAQRIALRRESSLLNPSTSGYYTEQLSLQCCRRRQESRSRPQEGRKGCPPRRGRCLSPSQEDRQCQNRPQEISRSRSVRPRWTILPFFTFRNRYRQRPGRFVPDRRLLRQDRPSPRTSLQGRLHSIRRTPLGRDEGREGSASPAKDRADQKGIREAPRQPIQPGQCYL
jgi:hypothetical protein